MVKSSKVFESETELPPGVALVVEGDKIKFTGSGKSLEAKFNSKVVKITVNGNKVIFHCQGKATRNKVAAALAAKAHLRNMLAGAKGDFSTHLQVIYAHFPVSIEVKGKEVLIKNFLGEKLPRTANIEGNAKIEVKAQDIYVTGSDKYAVGQTASNIVRATMIRLKDRRVFQDGIYPVGD